LQFARRGARAVVHQRCRHRALAATGEHPRMASDCVGNIVERELRCTFLAGEMPKAESASETRIASRSVGEHEQVLPMWVGCMTVDDHSGIDLVLRVGFAARDSTMRGQRDLGAEHGG